MVKFKHPRKNIKIVGLEKLLGTIASSCAFLFADNHFRFVDSHVALQFDGNCSLILQSERIQIRFIRDRGQQFVEFRSLSRAQGTEWYSIDIVKELITGEPAQSGQLDAENTLFLRQGLEEIESLFEDDALARTIPELRRLEMARAKRHFG